MQEQRSTRVLIVLTFFRSFDDELKSVQIVIYARIMKHTCSYCIESSLNARPSPETPNNGKCSKNKHLRSIFLHVLPDSTKYPTKTTLNDPFSYTGFLKAKWRQTFERNNVVITRATFSE